MTTDAVTLFPRITNGPPRHRVTETMLDAAPRSGARKCERHGRTIDGRRGYFVRPCRSRFRVTACSAGRTASSEPSVRSLCLCDSVALLWLPNAHERVPVFLRARHADDPRRDEMRVADHVRRQLLVDRVLIRVGLARDD